MARSVFINLPVADLDRSMEFFGQLGFDFDPRFTDEKAACMVIKENDSYAMLLTEQFFRTFTPKEVADPTSTTEAILALGVDSRQEVDEMANTALRVGGRAAADPVEQGPMYSRSFQDPDGHIWEVMHMDLTPAQ